MVITDYFCIHGRRYTNLLYKNIICVFTLFHLTKFCVIRECNLLNVKKTLHILNCILKLLYDQSNRNKKQQLRIIKKKTTLHR